MLFLVILGSVDLFNWAEEYIGITSAPHVHFFLFSPAAIVRNRVSCFVRFVSLFALGGISKRIKSDSCLVTNFREIPKFGFDD